MAGAGLSGPAAPAGAQLFCSDLDGTLLGDASAARRFRRAWERTAPDSRPILCYASGRLVPDALVVIGDLPLPDYLIGGVGTEIYDVREQEYLLEFEQALVTHWSARRVSAALCDMPGIERQPAHLNSGLKSSWYFPNASEAGIQKVRRALREAGLDANVVYSSGRDLDVLPGKADKGFALKWLCARLGIRAAGVIVAGDSGNDLGMLRIRGVRGIVVANAQPELGAAANGGSAYLAGRPFADGVLEGLRRYRVIEEDGTRPEGHGGA